MNMNDLAYYNGKIGVIDEMSVPFCDRVHFFGDGVYEVTLARNYIIYSLYEHVDRFYRSAKLIDINIPVSRDELCKLLCGLVRKLDHPDQLVYWQVTRGSHPRSHAYPENMTGNLWVMLKEGKPKDISIPVAAVTSPDTRFLHCNVKSLNLIPSVITAQRAFRSGVYETILYRNGGRVTECSHSNVHIINQRGIFQTAPADEYILEGIARAHLIAAARKLGIEVDESPFTVEEMMSAKEIMISSSTAFCFSCNRIDGISVGGDATDTVDALRRTVISDFSEKTGGYR